MKSLYTSAFLFACCIALSLNAVSQTEVKLDIRHLLNAEPFVFLKKVTTPEGIPFNVNRMEYYLAELSVTHDGGQVTEFDDLWLLVDAGSTALLDLGNANIQSVESIGFSVGVEEAFNHLDPAAWPMSHPLAPKNPSMHWGWASGYRFVAMQGLAGPNLDEVFEIHALEDVNYLSTSVNVAADAVNGEVIITIYADYAQALRGVDISSGVISHGGKGESVDLLKNFRDYVFTPSVPIDSIPDSTLNADYTEAARTMDVRIAPNPAANGTIRLIISSSSSDSYSFSAFDLAGKRMDIQQNSMGSIVELRGFEPGVYFVTITDQRNGSTATRKVVLL